MIRGRGALKQLDEFDLAERRKQKAPDGWNRIGVSKTRLVLGGKEMWSLAKTYAMVAACLAVTGIASAVHPPRPFVSLSIPSKPLDLGEVYGPGSKQLTAKVTARVVSNCSYRVEASFQGLKHERGKVALSAANMSVAINGREVPVGNRRVLVATSQKPALGKGVDVPIELRVGMKGSAFYPAGRYGGTLMITVMAGP